MLDYDEGESLDVGTFTMQQMGRWVVTHSKADSNLYGNPPPPVYNDPPHYNDPPVYNDPLCFPVHANQINRPLLRPKPQAKSETYGQVGFQFKLQCSTIAEAHRQVHRQWPSIEPALLNRCRHTWTGAQAVAHRHSC